MRYWPLFDLRLSTDRVCLRFPSLDDFGDLAELEAESYLLNRADESENASPEAVNRGRQAMLSLARDWGRWTADDWICNLVVRAGETVVGTQSLCARDFRNRREVWTGSWLGRPHRGQGIGTHMRAAVLDLAFDGLGAEYATSSAYSDNQSSLSISRKLGYQPDGIEIGVRDGRAEHMQRLRLSRADWLANRSIAVTVSGLESCLSLFGVDHVPSQQPPAGY